MGTSLAEPGSFTGSVDPKLGLTALKIKWAAASLQEAITGAIPDSGAFAMLVEVSRTFERDASGSNVRWKVTSTVEGHQTPDAADGEEYEVQFSTGEDKLETCETFDLVLDAYKGNIDSQTGRVKFPQKIDGERNPAHGIETFYNGGLTWVKKWTATKLDPSFSDRVGKIDNPPGNPPELKGNRNWLLLRITGNKRGNIWVYTAHWLQSGPYGWLPEIYAPR